MQKLTLSLLCAGLITTTAIAEDICNGAYQSQNYEQAAVCYVKQLKKERTFNNLLSAGVSYNKQGRYKEALIYLKEAEKKAISPNDYVIAYSWLSSSHSALGNSKQELAYSMKSLDLSLKSGNREDIGTSYSNLGAYYTKENQPQKALEFFEKALEYQEELERAITYQNMADNANDCDKAEELFHKSIEISQQIGDNYALAITNKNFGTLYYSCNRTSQAYVTYEKAVEISRKTKQIDVEAHSLSALAMIDHGEGKVKKSKEEASEALRLAKLSGNISVLEDAQYAWNLVNGK